MIVFKNVFFIISSCLPFYIIYTYIQALNLTTKWTLLYHLIHVEISKEPVFSVEAPVL